MTELQQVDESLDEIDSGTEQYLSFILNGEEYGVEILRVQEIKGWEYVTPIPNTPDHLCGVLNLRGSIVPVVNLRCRFDMPLKKFTPTTVVIVLKIEGVTQRTVGIVVDAVSDAHNIMPSDIRVTPDFGSQVDTSFITGVVPIGNDMMMILDIDSLLSVEALG
ncbi:MAG: purine-binding chemotaxis protein CheW [Piscirickettsiaceae bacterium]|nr:purine-binding chemotaxis protein CheW [Piscirickettsiaceae bacterium]